MVLSRIAPRTHQIDVMSCISRESDQKSFSVTTKKDLHSLLGGVLQTIEEELNNKEPIIIMGIPKRPTSHVITVRWIGRGNQPVYSPPSKRYSVKLHNYGSTEIALLLQERLEEVL